MDAEAVIISGFLVTSPILFIPISISTNFIWQNIKKRLTLKTKYAAQPVHVHIE